MCDLPSLNPGWHATPGSSRQNTGHSWLSGSSSCSFTPASLTSGGERGEERRRDRASRRVITHSRLLSPQQTILSNRTGHGQLWHVPEQRMHYLQVGGHFSSKQRDTNVPCPPSLRESAEVEEETAERWERAGTFNSNVDSFNEHT